MNHETDKERWLRLDLENAQDQLRREHEQQAREKEQRSREWHEEMRSVYRSADDWPEALRKQAHLFSGEVDGDYDPTDKYKLSSRDVDYFAQGMDACRALSLWGEISLTKDERRKKLQEQLDAIEMEIRREVSDKLDSERHTQGWESVANAIRDEDTDLSTWLNW